jgi:uncharacterized protein (TIGR02246 family)
MFVKAMLGRFGCRLGTLLQRHLRNEANGKEGKMQQDYAADPKTTDEIRAFVREYEEGFNRHDATVLVALCTEDAVQVSPEGPICGREAIEKNYIDFFQRSHPTSLNCTIDQVYRVGEVSWNSGGFSFTLQGEDRPVSIKGYRLDILVREGDAWKECISCYNMASTPPPL